jgi:NAD(P) transhydrogenase subunit alpha
VAGKVTNVNGVKIVGYTDLVSRLPNQASQLYSNNLVNLAKLVCPEKDGTFTVNFDDQVVRNMTVVNADEITFPPPPIQVSAAPVKPAVEKVTTTVEEKLPVSQTKKHVYMGIGALLFAWVASVAPADFLSHFTVFVLACVIGYNVVWNVSHSLHTPLMSVTNAISGIIIVGALLQIGQDNILVQILAGIAVLIATINIVGGFVVTKRMLKMFRR